MRTKKALATVIIIFAILLPSVIIDAEAASSPVTNAKADFLINMTTGEVYYEKNADNPRAPASLTKLMTVLMLYEAMDRGEVTKETLVGISSHTYSVASDPGGSNVPLSRDKQYTVDELLHAAMTVSANGAACALGELMGGTEESFAAQMTDRARAYGWDMIYYDASGLDDRNCVTARSMAMLATKLITKYPDVLTYASCSSINFRGRTYKATNRLLPGGSYAFSGADGLKTGTTTLAGMCLAATCQRDGNRLLAIILGAGSTSVRYGDAVNMFNYGFSRTITMNQTQQLITMNSRPLSMPAYFIDGHNYVRLRDLAAALAGTNQEFSVGWDEDSRTITITTGVPEPAPDGTLQIPSIIGVKQNLDSVVVDGDQVSLSGYVADGQHYFALYEAAQLFGLRLNYDDATKTVEIGVDEKLNVTPVQMVVSTMQKSTRLQAYRLGDTVVIDPRDLAVSLADTINRYNVVWDDADQALHLETESNYTPVGGELTLSDSTEAFFAAVTGRTIYIGGNEYTLPGAVIEDREYFSLDGIAGLVGFSYVLDIGTNIVRIEN